ncbi:Uncharacterised protein [Mycobacteroides abscessus]|nr:Uncharacterised protein [Mycobacteroides abscessus]
MRAIARGLGAPESVPAGNVARKASSAVAPSRSVPTTVEHRCMMWLNRLVAMNSTTSTDVGSQTLTRSLRERSTSMMCSASSLGSSRSSSPSATSSSGVAPRGREPAMGNVVTRPSSTLTSVSGLDPTTAKSRPSASVSWK